MSDDWAVGDLALCVDDGPCACGRCPSMKIPGLIAGKAYNVLAVEWDDRGFLSLETDRPLTDDEFHYGLGCAAARFRKIRPDAHEGSADDWVLILETTKRKVRA